MRDVGVAADLSPPVGWLTSDGGGPGGVLDVYEAKKARLEANRFFGRVGFGVLRGSTHVDMPQATRRRHRRMLLRSSRSRFRSMTNTALAKESVPVTVVIPVLNEALNLGAALTSVRWASEVFVVDSGSSDGTVAIAQAHGAKVVHFDYELGMPKKKAWSLRNLPFANEWALYLDGDERSTEELSMEIADVLAHPDHDGYYLDRDFIFRGKKMRGQPDWNLRLFRHTHAVVEDLGMHQLAGTGDNEIHEHFIVEGSTGFLRSPLSHDDYRGIGSWIERHNTYATWEAHLYRRLRSEPIGFSLGAARNPVARNRLLRRVWVRLPARPLVRFLAWYFGKRALVDGWLGFQYSFLMAWYELIISFKLSELEQR